MKVILSENCLALTGMLERGLGYHLVPRRNNFYARRNAKGYIPPDGHWRFIVLCAELARNQLHISDIEVSSTELGTALNEARIGYIKMFCLPAKKHYNAEDVLFIKERHNL